MASNDFSILLGAKIDTSKVQKQIDAFTKKDRKISLNFVGDTKSLKIIDNELRKIDSSVSSIQKHIDSTRADFSKLGNSGLKELSRQMEVINTETHKYINSQNELVTRITKTTEAGQQFQTVIKQSVNDLNQLTTTTQEFAKIGGYFQPISNSIRDVESGTAKVNSVLKELTAREREAQQAADALAQSQQKMYEISRASAERSLKSQRLINEQMVLHRLNADATGKAVNGLAGHIANATKKVALFAVSTAIIGTFTASISTAITTVKDFDEALTEFKKVSDLSGLALDNYTKKLGELGQQVARTREEMVRSATVFKRSGFDENDAAKLAQIAELYRNIADVEISSEDSAMFIISQLKAFDDLARGAEGAEHAISALNNVSNNMAVSSADLATGLSKTASAMATAGNTYEQSLALLTASTEIMQGQASKASRGLRTISANIAKAANGADEMTITVNGVAKSIELVNKATGEMLAPYEVFSQISDYWTEMNDLEKSNLAITLGGKNQLEVLTSVVSNFGAAEKALGLAINDQNSAWKENDRYLESIEAKANGVKAAWSEIILGDGGISDLIKNILDATSALLKFLQTDFGGFISKVGLATLAVVALNAELKKTTTLGLGQWLTTIGENIVGLIKYYSELATVTNVATASQVGFNRALEAVMAHPIVLVLTAVAAEILLVTNYIKEQREELENLNVEISNLSDEINNLETEKKNLESLKELNEQQAQRVKLLEEELKAKKKLLEAQYEEDSKTRQKRESSNTHGVKSFWQGNQTDDYFSTAYGTQNVKASLNVDTKDVTTGINDLVKAYNVLKDTKAESLEQDAEIESQKAAIIERLTEEGNALLDLKEKGIALSESDQELLDSIMSVVDGLGEVKTEADITSQTIANLAEQYGVSEEAIQNYLEEHPELIEQLGGEAEAAEYAAQQLSKEVESLTDLVQKLSDTQNAYNTLAKVEAEYNSTGTVTASTLKSLTELGAEFQACLELEEGQLTVNAKKFEKIRIAQIREAEAKAIQAAQADLAAISNEKYKISLEEAGDVAEKKKTPIELIGQAALQSGIDAANGAIGWDEYWRAVDNANDKFDFSSFSEEQKKQADEVKNNLQNTLTFLESQVSKGADYIEKGNAKASGSSKKASSSTKDTWLEAYKAEKDALESLYKTNVITAEEYAEKLQTLSDKYLTDSAEHQKKYAKEIHDAYESMYTALKKSAKEALDEEADRLKKQLDTLKDEKTAKTKELKRMHEEEEKSIKNRIDALKREKDAIKDDYDAKIKALKDEREEYERQVKLMQLKEALAKAKSTKQYVMDETGKFTYQEDRTAVDEASEKLIEEEQKQQYERELDTLEKARDEAVAIYEERIQALEDYYDKVKDLNDKAEEDLADHYDKLIEQAEKNYNNFKENSEKYLNGQIQVADNENGVWVQRLRNLADFVNNYNALMSKLGDGSTSNGSSYKGSTGGNATITSGGSGGNNATSAKGTKTTYYNANTGKQVLKPYYAKQIGARASGDASISSNGVYLVGDSPNRELVIGSKLNGVPLTLSKGDGVVNSKSTNTLAGMLNMLGSGFGKAFKSNNIDNGHNITIGNVSLPSVTNAEEFISCLQNFDIDMLQRAY